MNKYINLVEGNIKDEHVCCIIRTRKIHPGIEAKKKWLSQRLKEGHVLRKLDTNSTVYIEYAPLESAWVPVEGKNYYYIYCLWIINHNRRKGYGTELMKYCIEDAKKNGKSGICMLGAKKQKSWFSDQAFAKKFGFEVVDTTKNGYQLLALSFDGTIPKFTESAKKEVIEEQDLTIYYDMQCPFIYEAVEKIKAYCNENNVPLNLIEVDTLEKAKNLPCAFNNWAMFYKGKFKTVNLLTVAYIKGLLDRENSIKSNS
ncbi:MAG: GNAT family N-acetyltransferase [Erysipelotrichales bacterium]|nr:GNAT family N-acetyltransferase [Erysipelotrichales bacterium]